MSITMWCCYVGDVFPMSLHWIRYRNPGTPVPHPELYLLRDNDKQNSVFMSRKFKSARFRSADILRCRPVARTALQNTPECVLPTFATIVQMYKAVVQNAGFSSGDLWNQNANPRQTPFYIIRREGEWFIIFVLAEARAALLTRQDRSSTTPARQKKNDNQWKIFWYPVNEEGKKKSVASYFKRINKTTCTNLDKPRRDRIPQITLH